MAVIANDRAAISVLAAIHGKKVRMGKSSFPGSTSGTSVKGSAAIVRFLLGQAVAVDLPDKHGVTPLMYAVAAGQERSRLLTSLLLKHGARVTAKDEWGNTALHYANAFVSMEAASLLLGAGTATADDHENLEGKTPAQVMGLRFDILSSERY